MVPLGPTMQKTRYGYVFSDQVEVQTHRMMGFGDAQAVRSGAQHSTAQLDQKKTIFRPGFLHSRAQWESKVKDHHP